MVDTFHAKGAGGGTHVFDVPDAGTNRAEIFAYQITRGDLTVIDEEGDAVSASARDELLGRLGFPAEPTPETSEVEAVVDAGPSTVPAGSIPVVIDWVRGADEGEEPTEGWAERAAAALEHEKAGKARPSLIEKLEDILASAEPTPETPEA